MTAEFGATKSCTLAECGEGLIEIVLDSPDSKVNKLDPSAVESLRVCMREIAANTRIRGVLLRSAKPGMFVAGADIQVIRAIRDLAEARRFSTELQNLLNDLSRISVPVVAAIEGPCLGGGCELALACSHRVASNHEKTQIGCPEVNLGIIPGAGGTQRLPRLIGVSSALSLILTGKPVNVEQARKLGLVDRVFPHAFFMESAREFLRMLVETPKKAKIRRRHRFQNPVESFKLGRQLIFKHAEKRILQQTKGFYPAPVLAIDVIRTGMDAGMAAGFAREADVFAQLAVSPISKNMIRTFFGTEALKKETGIPRELSNRMTPKRFERIGLIGAGLMGSGIAHVAADKGIQVRMKDVNSDVLLAGYRRVCDGFYRLVQKGRITDRDVNRKMHLISPTVEYRGFRRAEVVVEAVVESLDVKRDVFRDLEAIVSDETILASNTSSLPVSQIAENCRRKDRVAGFHFFNPVYQMPLVEVIRSDQTSDETIFQLAMLAKKMGKSAIVVKDRPGFLVNRILVPYLNEAGYLYTDGASIELVDQVALQFGMPMGPFRLLDEIGLDTAQHMSETLEREFGERLRPATLVRDLVEKGFLGRKNGRGFFSYRNGKKTGVNPALPTYTAALGDEALIQERLLLSMINEAARCLDEQIVREAWIIDMALVMAIGFPPFRGGILQVADDIGIALVFEKLEKMASQHGDRFQPAARLREMRSENRKFNE